MQVLKHCLRLEREEFNPRMATHQSTLVVVVFHLHSADMIICDSPQRLGGIITQMTSFIISYVCFLYLLELSLKGASSRRDSQKVIRCNAPALSPYS